MYTDWDILPPQKIKDVKAKKVFFWSVSISCQLLTLSFSMIWCFWWSNSKATFGLTFFYFASHSIQIIPFKLKNSNNYQTTLALFLKLLFLALILM
jgi:hypothetical protein